MKRILGIAAALLLVAVIAHAETLSIPLSKLAAGPTAELRCIRDEYAVSLPIPERWKVSRAVLTLKYVNASTLVPGRSHLAIKFNDSVIGQVKLDPQVPEKTVTLPIPVSLLKPGYQSLSFVCAQHYATECEQFCSPNLWTTIDLDGSRIELEYDLLQVSLKLSELSNFLFDPKILPSARVNIVAEGLTSDTVTQAGIVASGIARKFDYRNVTFGIGSEIMPGSDTVLIGDKKYVETFLKARHVDVNVPGPFIKISHLPISGQKSDTDHALLIVSGRTQDEIKLAAETFAHLSLPLPGSDEMTVSDFALPDITMYKGRQVLTSDKTYPFKTVAFDTTTFSGFNPNPRHLSFRLPADFMILPNQYAKVHLNFSYGAGMRSDSVLNVLVNDKSVRVIHLNNTNGENIEGYRIDLPTYLFKAGYNTIRFAPILNPNAQECDLLRPEGFYLTIFDNSTLWFPAMPHFLEMPKLELFLVDGFPITRWPDGFETMFYLATRDYETASAALNLIGIISQKNGYPLFGTRISFEKPDAWTGELVMLGDVQSIPAEISAGAPVKLGAKSVIPYPVIRDWDSDTTFALSGQASSLGPDIGVIMEYQSPHKTGRSILEITGNSSKEVLATSVALLESAVQTRVKGDAVLIDLHRPMDRVQALSAGARYFTGRQGVYFLFQYYFYRYTYLIYMLMFVAIAALSFIVYGIVRKIRLRRSRNDDETGG